MYAESKTQISGYGKENPIPKPLAGVPYLRDNARLLRQPLQQQRHVGGQQGTEIDDVDTWHAGKCLENGSNY